jgi:hypothetical protein
MILILSRCRGPRDLMAVSAAATSAAGRGTNAVPLGDESRVAGEVIGPTSVRWNRPMAISGPPNETRLSCGALKKDSFLNLRAPAASSAC